VSEFAGSARRLIEGSLGSVCVEGEVSGYRMQASGHQYFTLKDERAQVACVWFAGRSSGRAVPLSDGMAVQVRGSATVYETQGKFQINVRSVQAAGTGLLQARFEALKRRLQQEGLFDQGRKRSLPRYPQTVALLTSPTGAVVQDMLKVLGRRAPWVRVLVYPAKVQGAGAAEEIAAGLQFLNAESGRLLPEIDVIICGRGGGSMEDLWCFNEEVVARALFASRLPVVSAVGHETDFTIADFVADHRAATPSVAAEMVVPDRIALKAQVEAFSLRMESLVQRTLRSWGQRVEFLGRSGLFREPRNRLEEAAQRLDGLAEALVRRIQSRMERQRNRVEQLGASVRAHRPDQVLALRRQQAESAAARLLRAVAARVQAERQRVQRVEQMVLLLSPQGTLERGYSIALNERGGVLRSIAEVAAGEPIRVRLRDGHIQAEVRATLE
jgi:exodeoxyribonuclease VII large subunit